MSYEAWKDKTSEFKTIDVRHLQGNFFPGLQKQAKGVKVGEGLKIIQTFEPHPLYGALEALGFEHHTEQAGEHEFHAYFYRAEEKGDAESAPFRMKPGFCYRWPMRWARGGCAQPPGSW